MVLSSGCDTTAISVRAWSPASHADMWASAGRVCTVLLVEREADTWRRSAQLLARFFLRLEEFVKGLDVVPLRRVLPVLLSTTFSTTFLALAFALPLGLCCLCCQHRCQGSATPPAIHGFFRNRVAIGIAGSTHSPSASAFSPVR